eukprot:ANDGO_07284.mRNA.1 Cys-loop ligand-gated ion channel
MHGKTSFWFLVVCLMTFSGIQRVASQVAPPYEPLNVYTKVYFNMLQKINGVEQTFNADFYLEVFWNNPTIDNQTPEYDPATNFNPFIEMINVVGTPEQTISSPYQVHASQPTLLLGYPAGDLQIPNTTGPWVQADFRFKGDFLVDINLRDFPFDIQTIFIIAESAIWANEQMKFVVLPANLPPAGVLPPGFEVQSWTIQGNRAEEFDYYYTLFQASYSRLRYAIVVKRDPGYYLSKFVIGVVVLVMMGFLCFALEVDEADRMMGSITVFLAIISYLFIASQDLPKVAYSTRIDSFMQLSYLTVFACMAVHAVNYLLFYILEMRDEDARMVLRIAEAQHAEARRADSARGHSSMEKNPLLRLTPRGNNVDLVRRDARELPVLKDGAQTGQVPSRGSEMRLPPVDHTDDTRKESVSSYDTYSKIRNNRKEKFKVTRTFDVFSVTLLIVGYGLAASLILTGGRINS